MPVGSRRIHATPVPETQTAVVQLPAEIDAANTGLVEAALTSALASRPQVLIADGSKTTFCDSAGIATLTELNQGPVTTLSAMTTPRPPKTRMAPKLKNVLGAVAMIVFPWTRTFSMLSMPICR